MIPHRLLEGVEHPETIQRLHRGYAALDRLPYKRLDAIDTEFRFDGNRHRPWCLCGIELRSGDPYQLWLDGYEGLLPFPLDTNTLAICYAAGAEVAALRAKKYQMLARIFDLFQEFRLVTNTGRRSDPRSLEHACAHYGIFTVDSVEKKYWREKRSTTSSGPTINDNEVLPQRCVG
jgi:hypothetical protein